VGAHLVKVCIYFIWLYKLTHVSKSICVSELWLEGGFLFWGCGNLPQSFESGFSDGFFWCSITEKHQSEPVRLPRSAYFVILKVDMTRIYPNENEEQPGGFPGRIIKEWYHIVQ